VQLYGIETHLFAYTVISFGAPTLYKDLAGDACLCVAIFRQKRSRRGWIGGGIESACAARI